MTSGLKERLDFWQFGTKLKLVLNFSSNKKLKEENSVFIKLVYPFLIYNNEENEKEEDFEQ